MNYSSPLANAVEKSQLAFGLDKYGITLDDVPDDQYNWMLMALEESVDKNQYLVRELRKQQQRFASLDMLNVAYNGRITRLNSQVEGLEEEQSRLLDENEELKKRLEDWKKVAKLVSLPSAGVRTPNDEFFSPKKIKEMMAHGISD